MSIVYRRSVLSLYTCNVAHHCALQICDVLSFSKNCKPFSFT